MNWQVDDLIGVERYWFERFCDRYGLTGRLARLAPGVSTLQIKGPAGAVKEVDLDDELMLMQLREVDRERGKQILESWLIFSIANTDPLANADFDPADRDYFARVERAAPHCRIFE